MRHGFRHRHCFSFLLVILAFCFTFSATGGAVLDQELFPRYVRPKPELSPVTPNVHSHVAIVKFVEGSNVRLREGVLRSVLGEELNPVRTLLTELPGIEVERHFRRSERELDLERIRGQELSGKELADLNLYYKFFLPDTVNPEEVVNRLNRMNVVELAFFPPRSEPAVDIPPPTPDWEASQDYIDPAPVGVDAIFAWTVPGGTGAGVQIIDIEGGWVWNHEDLKTPFYNDGDQNSGWEDHGTAVVSEMIGGNNGYGVTGISYDAAIGGGSIFHDGGGGGFDDVAPAINDASAALDPGDVFLIELHAGGSCGGYICMEYWQDIYDAIAAATANGRICVEAGGNGDQNMDGSCYGNLFDRTFRDSGAIIVGAGAHEVTCCGYCGTPELSRLSFSNYGSRVDLQGYGDGVYAAGYGDLFDPLGSDQEYTACFGGTSGASPIVTASCASLQGVARALGLNLTPAEMRDILVQTGTPENPIGGHIGPRPDLRAAIEYLQSTVLVFGPQQEFGININDIRMGD